MTQRNIPLDLLHSLENRHDAGVYVFLGAGISYNSGIPTSKQLIEIIRADETNYLYDFVNENHKIDLWNLAEVCQQETSDKYFREFITNNLSTVYNSEISTEYMILQFLIGKGYIKKVYTTNIDCMLEYVLDKNCIKYNKYSHIKGNNTKIYYESNINGNCDIIKLCGDIHSPFDMCFSKADIKEATTSSIFQAFLNDFKENKTFIFIGYSFYKDAIGKSIRQCIQERNQSIYVVNIDDEEKINLGDEEDYRYFQENAESFFKRLVKKLRPHLNIDHITFNDDGFGGVQTYYETLKKIMSKYLNNKVTYNSYPIFDTFKNLELENEEELKGMPRIRVAASMKLYDVVSQKRKGDVIHAHNSISAYHAHSLEFPVVLTSHSLLSSEMKYDRVEDLYNSKKEILYWENEYYSSLPYIIALSEAHRKELPKEIQHYTRILDAPFYLEPFLDANIVDCSPEEARKKIRNKVIGIENSKFDTKKFTVAFVGRCTIRKGIEIVHKVFDELFANYPNKVQLLYIGPELVLNEDNIEYKPSKSSSNDCENGKVSQCYKASFLNSVFYYKNDISDNLDKHLKEMCIGYKAADIVIAPSLYEPFGYVALEALASKRLIIAGKTGGFKEILANQRGELVDIEITNKYSIEKISHNIYIKINDLITRDNYNNIRLKDNVNKTIKNGFDYICKSYSEDNQMKLAKEMYEIYLNSITTGTLLAYIENESLMKVTNDEFNNFIYQLLKERLEDNNSFEKIIYTTSLAYLDIVDTLNILKGNSVDNILKRETLTENYNLFWEIATFLKRNKAMCKAIKIMETKILAETVTESTRCLFNIIKNKTRLVVYKDEINDVLLNKKNNIFHELICIYINKEEYRKSLLE
ncbi:Glycosyltransferase involved in cell wall bisynthesis [Clostridium cavendishii DSM 21758]|uniref:Glycosyltransferase involved in cell wall bisynthesis n=1 Tax=Clostridium cavendishii DSM 21758 TaxID=1121302 RepID=A0A1M6NDX3_9CLOT|nr:glycosyltransferase [Clostridium cavendishii]SHJ93917.1 Glycosyltransferase involved in cell wall bisynthesis [Clostridium cavendishii DSM 21758]